MLQYINVGCTMATLTLALGVRCFELIWLIIALLSLLNATLIARKRHVFHRNLLMLFGYLAFGGAVVVLSQFTICVASFIDARINADTNIFLQTTIFRHVAQLRLAACFVESMFILVIAIERIIATLSLRSYEQQRARTLNIFLLNCFSWIYGIIACYCAYACKRASG